MRNEIDIVLSGFFIREYSKAPIQFSEVVYSDQLCIFTAKGEALSQSLLSLLVLQKSFFLITPTASVFVIVWWILRLFNIRIRRLTFQSIYTQLLWILNDTMVVWARRALKHLPIYRSERILFIIMALLSVVFGVLFESNLATTFIRPIYYKDIKTLQDLDERNFDIYTKYRTFADDIFSHSSSPLYASLQRKIKITKYNTSIMKMLYNEKNVAGINRRKTLLLTYFDDIVSNKLWIVPECPKTYSLSYVVPVRSPFIEPINRLLMKFKNAGLIDVWFNNDIEYKRFQAIKKYARPRTKDAKHALNINDLQLFILFLLIGYFLSFSTFLGEFWFHWYRTRKKLTQTKYQTAS